MSTFIIYLAGAVLAVGIGVALFFLLRTKISRREFDATRDLFI
jgi:hypothetical protein